MHIFKQPALIDDFRYLLEILTKTTAAVATATTAATITAGRCLHFYRSLLDGCYQSVLSVILHTSQRLS